jgi:hypothetical protein
MEGKTLALAVGMAGLVAVGVGTLVLHTGGPPEAPPLPKPPPPPETLMNAELKYSPTIYRALIEQDAKRFRVKAPSAAALAKPFPYFEELKGLRRLKPGAPLETPHLRLSLTVEKHQATIEGQSFRYDHLVLRIQNRTPHHLAYRVRTAVPDHQRCSSKGDIPHNAIVIGPQQTISRTECLYRKNESVELQGVEVMEMPALAAHYASRLPATMTLYDRRTARGHTPLDGELCPQTFSWREIQEGVDNQEIGWRDVVDFYARHSCDEYSFFRAYRYRTNGAAPLPARPLD